jgi:hypothetical protein
MDLPTRRENMSMILGCRGVGSEVNPKAKDLNAGG